VLDLEDLPADAHFFALGGDSLQALEVTSALQDELGRELPLELLYEHPELTEFAARVAGLAG
jgi:acyl carrier protein